MMKDVFPFIFQNIYNIVKTILREQYYEIIFICAVSLHYIFSASSSAKYGVRWNS